MDLKRGAARTINGAARAVPLAGLLWLGACAFIDEALNPPEPEPVVIEAEPAPVAEPPLPPAPKPRPARVARLPSPTERPTPAPTSVQPVPPEPPPQPEVLLPEIKIVGMSRGETATLLGTPSEERDA